VRGSRIGNALYYLSPHPSLLPLKGVLKRVPVEEGTAVITCIYSRVPDFNYTTTRQLDFYHTHTMLNLSIVYHDGKDYIPQALEKINHFLSDFRTGDIHAINPGVLDILHALHTQLGGEGTFEIISAYRSPKTNTLLRENGKGVAKNSLHMQGKAIDVRLRGVDSARLRDAAIKLGRGGGGIL